MADAATATPNPTSGPTSIAEPTSVSTTQAPTVEVQPPSTDKSPSDDAPKVESADATSTLSIEAVPTAVTSAPTWPSLPDDHPLSKLLQKLPDILTSTAHNEIYGVTLKPKLADTAPDFHTLLILQKFLRANQNDILRAQDQLTNTLAWRKEYDPIKASQEIFAKDKFAGLGYITVVNSQDDKHTPSVTTWNIYGAVKDYEKTFTPVESFLRWRIALMELGVAKLELAKARIPIPDHDQGTDPYQGIQVHDYKNVSFLRMDSRAKAASKQAIQLLGDYYPETLSRKFFVNVPIFMEWMFTFSKAIISAETAKKFAVLNDGKYVVTELGENVPEEYGGKLSELSITGESLRLE